MKATRVAKAMFLISRTRKMGLTREACTMTVCGWRQLVKMKRGGTVEGTSNQKELRLSRKVPVAMQRVVKPAEAKVGEQLRHQLMVSTRGPSHDGPK